MGAGGINDGPLRIHGYAVEFRPAENGDIAAMAAIRARESQTQTFWEVRIRRYMTGEHSPQHALAARVTFVAVEGSAVAGFVSGHLTRRYQCDGELQWLNVAEAQRGRGIASELLNLIAGWFLQQSALRLCVNVDPTNASARRLYAKHGAQPLNDYWLVWENIRYMGAPAHSRE